VFFQVRSSRSRKYTIDPSEGTIKPGEKALIRVIPIIRTRTDWLSIERDTFFFDSVCCTGADRVLEKDLVLGSAISDAAQALISFKKGKGLKRVRPLMAEAQQSAESVHDVMKEENVV